MASTINASNSGFGGIVSTGDSSGQLQLQTAATTALTLDTSQNATFAGKVASAGALTLASNGTTTAVTIDTSQNVGIGTTSPSVRLHLKGASYANAIRWEETGGSNNFYAGPFDSSGNFGLDNNSTSGYTRFVTNSTERMRIDSSGNVLVGTTATSAAKLTVNGNIAPIGAPNAFWGLDYATTTSAGNYITIANNATYSFASGSGATFVYEDSGAVGAVMFMSVYGTTYTVWQSGTGYSNVPTTASKVNFGYSSGAYYLENKTGSSKNFYISNIRMRQGS